MNELLHIHHFFIKLIKTSFLSVCFSSLCTVFCWGAVKGDYSGDEVRLPNARRFFILNREKRSNFVLWKAYNLRI